VKVPRRLYLCSVHYYIKNCGDDYIMKTMKEAAEAALTVQSACNLSGVVHSFSQATDIIWEEARKLGKGIDFVNQHPVSRLFAEQISHLTSGTEYIKAYSECERFTEEVA